METKTKYRILGVLIILGLIIVLLPLFLSEKEEQQPDVAVIKAPAFPDQTMQISGNTDNTDASSGQFYTESSSDVATANVAADAPNTNNSNSSENKSVSMEAKPETPLPNITDPEQPAPEVTSDLGKGAAFDTEAKADDKVKKVVEGEKVAENKAKEIVKEEVKAVKAAAKEEVKPVSKKVAHTAKATKHKKENVAHAKTKAVAASSKKAAASASLSTNGLMDLKNPAWVIQIGSFKNKPNAIRLVNRLRSNGYKTFVQHVNNPAFGETIRVYVGPEDKQASAFALADRLAKDLHVAGIVISYKPLAL